MTAVPGTPAVARTVPVPAGRRLLAGGQGDLASLLDRFPPRAAETAWAATRQPRDQLLGRLLSPPFRMGNAKSQSNRKAGAVQLLDWLESLPGGTWQERWAAGGAEEAADWRDLPSRWLRARNPDRGGRWTDPLGTGMILLVTGDVLRPGLSFLLTATGRRLAEEMARARDPAGPRPAGGLPEGTPAVRRLRHPAEPRAAARISVLAGPGAPPPRDRLAAASPGRRRRVEAAGADAGRGGQDADADYRA